MSALMLALVLGMACVVFASGVLFGWWITSVWFAASYAFDESASPAIRGEQ